MNEEWTLKHFLVLNYYNTFCEHPNFIYREEFNEFNPLDCTEKGCGSCFDQKMFFDFGMRTREFQIFNDDDLAHWQRNIAFQNEQIKQRKQSAKEFILDIIIKNPGIKTTEILDKFLYSDAINQPLSFSKEGLWDILDCLDELRKEGKIE